MEKKNTVAFVVISLSLMLLFASNIPVANALTITSVTGLSNVRIVKPYTTGSVERVFVLHTTSPLSYSVYQYSNATGTPVLNLVTNANLVINGVDTIVAQTYVQIAEDSARLWFAVRNGTGANTGFIVSFNKATNAVNYYSVGRCAPVYMVMVGSELFTSSLQAGSSGSICTQTRQIVSWDTNALSTSLTVNSALWNSGASESGWLSLSPTNNIIVMCESSPASPRIQPINYITHSLGSRFGSGTSPYVACVSDGSFVYGTRQDGTIDKFTGSAMTTTGWKSGLGAPAQNSGNNIAYKNGQLYVSNNVNLFNIQTSDAVTLSQSAIANANAQTLASRGVYYHVVSTTEIRRVLDGASSSPASGGANQVDGVCGQGTALECVGDRSTINQITGAQNFTTVIGNLGTQLGILNTTANTDPETNGSGLILMLATGTFFASAVITSIAVANNKFGANIQYTQIPKEFWLFLVVGVIALSWYLNWVPDIVFYGMIVGIAGLFAFGLYKQYNGNGG